MKLVAFVGIASIVGGTYYFADPFVPGEVYALSPAQALEQVENVDLGFVESMLHEAGAGDNPIVRSTEDGKVQFAFMVKGHQVGTYTVTAKPEDATHTKVSTVFEMAPDADANMQGTVLPMGKRFAIVGKAILNESVDAALDGRPYDPKPEHQAMQAYALANMGEIQNGAMKTMNEAAAQANKGMEAEAEARAAAARDAGARIVPGQPMVNPGVPTR